MLILYGQNETSFTSGGLGILADAISCTVIHAEDGTYELELEYPVNGPLHSQLVNRAIIMAKPSHNLPPQPFRIDGITRPHNGKIKYYAKHISYDLSDVPISPYSAEQDTTVTPNIPSYVNAVSGIAANMVSLPGVSLSNFSFGVATPYKDTKKANEEKFKLEGPASAKEVMDKISSTYKNCMWDFKFQNGTCACVIYSDGLDPADGGATLGSDNGVTLYYGKDFTDIEQESLFSKAVSAIYPFWKRSSTSTTQSVSGLLLEGLKNFAAGESSASKIAEKTGLDHSKVIEYIKEYMSSEPHVVDLSEIGGSTIGGTTSTTAIDGHTGDGHTATFTFSFDFNEITQVTVADKKIANTRYTINNNADGKPISITFHEGYIPADKAEIKITGPIPDVVEITGKIYAPEGHSVGYTKILPVDLSSEFSNPPPRNDLLDKAKEYWNQNRLGEPEVSIDLTYADIKRINEYTNINSANILDIGDVVTINFVNVGILSKVRITKTEYDPIIDMYTSLELGVPKKTLAGTIVETRKNVSNKANTDQVSDIVSDSVIMVQTMYALGDNKTDPPQVVRAPGTDPEIDTGEDTTWSLTAPTPVPGKYLWSKVVTIYASGKQESSNYTCIDNGSSENTAAIGTAVLSSQNVYYVTTSNIAPSAPGEWVTSTSTDPGDWRKVIPNPIYNGKYYYCVQIATKNGNFTNSPVYRDTANSLLYTWVSSTNTTVINGGMIAANTVTANQLAADAVKSINYNYTSGYYSNAGTMINLTDGSIRSKNFAIDNSGNAYFKGDIHTSSGTIGEIGINQYGLNCSEVIDGVTYNYTVFSRDRLVIDDAPLNDSAFIVERAGPLDTYNGIRLFWAGGSQGVAQINAIENSISMSVDGGPPASIQLDSSGGDAKGTLSGDWYLDDDLNNTIAARLNSGGGVNTWRPIRVEGSQIKSSSAAGGYINFVGDHSPIAPMPIYVYAEDSNTIKISTIPSCLIEGTKILMADGSEKNIEDLKSGDEIASFDINRLVRNTAIVISAQATGGDFEYTTHLFSNGSYIISYGKHSVYNKTLGHPTDISNFRLGDETYDSDGEVITYVGNMRYAIQGGYKCHYDLNTSNNLYFANGILNGKKPFAKYRAMQRYNMVPPEEISNILASQRRLDEEYNGYSTDPDYFASIAAALKDEYDLEKIISDAKQKLADTDYIVAKFTENLLSLTEWSKAKTERAGYRSTINSAETALKAAKKVVKDIKKRFRKTPKTLKDRFEEYSILDNNAIDIYRSWLQKGETKE